MRMTRAIGYLAAGAKCAEVTHFIVCGRAQAPCGRVRPGEGMADPHRTRSVEEHRGDPIFTLLVDEPSLEG